MKRLLLILLLFVSSLFGIILEWDPNTESNLAGYKVYYGAASRVYTTTVDVGNVTQVQLPTLPGTTYYAVTAYDTDGLESDFSDEVFYTAPAQFFIWQLPAGQITIEHTFGLLSPITWLPVETVTGPRDYPIVVDKNLPQEYFRWIQP